LKIENEIHPIAVKSPSFMVYVVAFCQFGFGCDF